MLFMKFRVFPVGLIYVSIYDLLSLFTIVFIISVPSEKDAWLWILSSIMFVLLPAVFSIYILSFSLDLIIIDSNGVKKYHYGKQKKCMSWNEIITFGIYPKNELQGWIFLSNKEVEYNTISSTFMMFDKNSICMKYSEKILNELNKYLNNKIHIK